MTSPAPGNLANLAGLEGDPCPVSSSGGMGEFELGSQCPSRTARAPGSILHASATVSAACRRSPLCAEHYRHWQFPERLLPGLIADALGSAHPQVRDDGRQVDGGPCVGDHLRGTTRHA